MKDYEFKKILAWATTLKKQGYHQRSAELLDVLSDALLYASTYNKELDDALIIVNMLYKRAGRETTKFLCMRSRDDREQALTCSLEELAAFLFDDRQEEEKNSDDLTKIIAFIKSNEKLYKALQKNASSQYLNRLLAGTSLQAKAAKLKKLFPFIQHLF